jgi:hypothetical protein
MITVQNLSVASGTHPPTTTMLEELFNELGELHGVRAGVQKKVLAHDIKQAMLGRGGGVVHLRRNGEVPGFGELLNGSIRDWIGVGHENPLNW